MPDSKHQSNQQETNIQSRVINKKPSSPIERYHEEVDQYRSFLIQNPKETFPYDQSMVVKMGKWQTQWSNISNEHEKHGKSDLITCDVLLLTLASTQISPNFNNQLDQLVYSVVEERLE